MHSMWRWWWAALLRSHICDASSTVWISCSIRTKVLTLDQLRSTNIKDIGKECVLWIAVLGLFSILAASLVRAKPSLVSQKGFLMSVQENARVRAPEITGGHGWLN